MAIGLLILPAILYASQRSELHDANRRISALESRLLRLGNERELLLVELATQTDPRRLDTKARVLAGLGPAREGQVTFLPRPSEGPSSASLVAATAGSLDGNQ